MIFALAGNQNCGKTTLLNQLTGSNQHVGNFPGVTVDQKSGPVRGQKDCTVVDLPGIYSLRPYTAEEIVTRDFILKNKPDGIINIVDATNLERNLYLTLQLLTLRVPTELALNMMDALPGNGGIAADAVCVSEIGAKDIPAQVEFAKAHGIDYAVVAPDDPLALGAVDALSAAGIPCFGPDKKAAIIEASKAFSKDLMKKYGIPTAKYELFTEAEAACAYIEAQGAPIVV